MKSLIASAVLATLATSASANAGEELNLRVSCWQAKHIAGMVEKKQFLVSRYYPAGFLNLSGHMAELIDPSDRSIVWFAFAGDLACMVAVAQAEPDDLKRVGLK